MRKIISGIAVLAIAGGFALAALVGSASAASVPPTVVPDNPTCADIGYGDLTELKIDPPQEGTFGGGAITISNLTDTTFDWSAGTGILVHAVIVKGGQAGANVYDYGAAGATSDTDLTTPDNPNGEPAGISHITFCFEQVETTTPPASSTPPPTTQPVPPSGPPQTGAGGTAGTPFPLLFVIFSSATALAALLLAIRRKMGA